MKRGLFFLITAILLASLAGCGGNASVDLEARGGTGVQPVNFSDAGITAGASVVMPTTPDMFGPARYDDTPVDIGFTGTVEPRVTPGQVIDFTALPDVRQEYPELKSGNRVVSGTNPVDLSVLADSSANAFAAGGTLTIDSSVTGGTEFARYALPLAGGDDLLGVVVQGNLTPGPAAQSTGLWIGFSNYSTGSWTFRGPYDMTLQVGIGDLDPARYSDENDIMHIVFVTTRGDSVEITSLSTLTETATMTVLPDAFYSGLNLAGMDYAMLSLRFGHEVLDPPIEDINYNTWGWYLYSYDGGTTFYEDLRSLLPSYWGGWSGAIDGGPFAPHEYPEYMDDKRMALEGATGLQDLIITGINEMPVDRRTPPQDFNPSLQLNDALARAVASYVTAAGGTADYPAYQTALSALNKADQDALAKVVAAAQDAYETRDTALTDFGLTTPTLRDDWFWWSHGVWAQTSAYVPLLIDATAGLLMRGFRYGTVAFEGSCKIADAVDDLTEYVGTSAPAWEDVNLDIETPAGRIVISGIGDDSHDQRIPAIVGKDSGTGIYSVAGDMTAAFRPGYTFTVYGATDDNGLKTVTSSAVNGPNTDITVTEALTEDTADGEIRLNGYAILIDLGGNDTYTCTAGATASGANGVSVCLDLAGDDTYLPLDDPLDGNRGTSNDDNYSQYGGGRLGVGILVDYDGADTYEAARLSEGFAMLGVGVLADYGAGDDVYTAESFSQGSAIGGVGLCFDDGAVSGNQYNIWAMGQGYGGVMGIGLLIQEGTSNDTFYAEPDYDAARPEYNSGQMPDVKNANFTQGAALGMRWGAYAGPSTGNQVVAAGGYGMLYDAGGDDDYTCGVFGQSVGFFHGHGLLIDGGGDDVHNGVWYTQGATAHCGLAGLWDNGGDDYYSNETSVGIGGAHDWSVTWFYEFAGNDTYEASSIALGTGYSNSYGHFIEMSGNDTYNATYSNGAFDGLGRGKLDDATRETQPCIGTFTDVRGADTYDPEYAGMLSGVDDTELVATPPDNGAAWIRVGGDWFGGGGFYALGYGFGIDDQ